jgi:NitT/TauT family transport system permease protein
MIFWRHIVETATKLKPVKTRGQGVKTWLNNYGYSIGTILAILIIWEVFVVGTGIKTYLLPSPVQVIDVMLAKSGLLLQYSLITSYEILLGYLMSLMIGIPLGMVIYYSKTMERIIYPFLVASQTVPKVAVAPLLVLWLGWGVWPKIVVAFLISFFPIVIDTVVGLKSTQAEMIYLVKSMGASQLQTFLKVSLPNALPNIFGAMKVASTLAVVGAVIGEFVAADKGLGYLLIVANGYLDTTTMFAGIVALSLLGIIFFFIIEFLERIFVPWRKETTGMAQHATL